MLRNELLGTQQVFLLEQPGIFALEKASPISAADCVPRCIPGDCRDETDQQQQRDVQISLRSKESGREQEAIAGQKKPTSKPVSAKIIANMPT